ncbi:MAG: peptidoglycan-binding protein [Gemmiger sp.]|nr:peptidoglycan-binding protein [Gemmiger sp.]
MPTGTLQVYTAISGQNAPLPGVEIAVYDEMGAEIARVLTDDAGVAPLISLEAPDARYSLDAANRTVRPYAVCSLSAFLGGWLPQVVEGIQIFDGQQAVARLAFLPAEEDVPQEDPLTVIPEHPLFVGGGGSAPTPAQNCPGSRVLTAVVIPKKITVHLGKPAASAKNVTVTFQNYIANVASSEVYPTWPEQALRANILAQISLALNRIYTEWYPSRGYSFNITNSTSYDQAFVNNRTIFAVMERLTAELFDTYVRRTGDAEPYYTEYCDGKSVSCPGMKQWGTVDRANAGMNALAILRYYYGNRVNLVTTNNIQSIPESYPGTPLRRGSTGVSVSILQKQLSRIAKDYPSFGKPTVNGTFDAATESSVKAFQKQFSLTADGVVGRATWNKASYIYVSVKDLAELTSEGEKLDAVNSSGAWPGTVLRRGSTGSGVEQIQFWLSGLAQFQSNIPTVAVDGNFGLGTENSVKAFQKSAGLTQDGVVGQATWDALYLAFIRALSDAGGTAYPGTALRTGSTGVQVRQVQFWLRLAADNYTALSPVAVDGRFGSGTAAAVSAFQQYFGLSADGVVGRATWGKLNEVGIAVANKLVGQNVQPGQFVTTLREGSSGTPVRALQYYLRLLAAYYGDQPSVTVDGVFGAATTAAVKAWQRRMGLAVDGIVGRVTWQSIYNNAISLAASGPVATLRTAPALTAALRLGDSGEDVLWLNRTLDFLAQWLPTIEPPQEHPALFDEALETAVKSAQAALGLPTTGIVTEADWRAFNLAALGFFRVTPGAATPEPAGVWPGNTLALDSAGPAVAQVQRWLNVLGSVYCGQPFVEETGLLDDATRTTLELYQTSVGLEPLGIVDDATWQSLKAAATLFAPPTEPTANDTTGG